MKNILAISGSTKKGASNEKIIGFIANTLSGKAHIDIYKGLKELPYFEPGLTDEQLPAEVKDFLDKINNADAILISTPEYVFSIPGVLKNALEWTVATTVLSDKPIDFIVAAASGEKAFESLDLILSTLVQYPIVLKNKLLIKGVGQYFDAHGMLTNESVKAQLTSLGENLIS
ncbi:NADPH-dependent FMN reductase [Pedobacter heparinus]|uniref:NADPH-dependent FMN reductase n=1 Tax=Pedobacter heparinus TaxID=984 RepID=UPI00292EC76A|nr:NADPH-dependent FMN reductase [Pedobacter heparinus]